MIETQLREQINNCLDYLKTNNKLLSFEPEISRKYSVNRAKKPEHGDFACNVAILLAKSQNQAPRVIAQQICAHLEKNNLIQKLERAGPGFINIWVSNNCLSQVIPLIITQGDKFGTVTQKNPEKIIIELVSANPTGGLHLGHARVAFMGDALARLLKAAGFEVVKEFYVNDCGNQIDQLARTIHKRYRELFGEKVEILTGEYPGEYVKDIAQELKNRDGHSWLRVDEKDWIKFLSKFGVDYNLKLIKNTLEKLGIHIDNYFFESELHKNKKLDNLIQEYKTRNLVYESDSAQGSEDKIRRIESKAAQFAHLQQGGLFLKTSKYGDDEDRIIQRKDGRFVYLTADLSYHQDKYERGFTRAIDVFGADHGGHIKRIRAGMRALDYDDAKLDFVLVQMVRIVRDGQELKFSKRSGQVLGIEDILELVGPDVIRFVFLMRSANAQFDLDLDLVTKNSNENPVFYVQYGHARLASLIRKAEHELGISINKLEFTENNQKILQLPIERELILKISSLAGVVQEAARVLEPHRILYFCQELVKLFHSYFTSYRDSEKIISTDKEKTRARILLVHALKITIFNALNFLGISAPDEMYHEQ